MTKIGNVFYFCPPDGWSESRDGSRYLFHGPDGEELIVSAVVIQGYGKTGDFERMQRALFKNAEQSIKAAASQSSLRVVRPFQRDTSVGSVEYWNLFTQTQDGKSLFYQAAFRDQRGILLLSYEAPNVGESVLTFKQVVESVGVSESGNTR